jgi:hypothetical protein
MTLNSRREFLADVGRGVLIATVGSQVASELGLAKVFAGEGAGQLNFGEVEPLVRLMQETPVEKLLPALAEKLRGGVELKRLVQAAALANARTFGGEDYIGFHTMMALGPALHMAYELPVEQQALPVFKVLYRNTNRIQEFGGRKNEVLHAVEAAEISGDAVWGEKIREQVRNKNAAEAERILAAVAKHSPEEAFNHVLFAVHDATEVHRVVLPYRAWDLMGLIGKEQATTLLRQSIHYCVKAESWPNAATWDAPKRLLPKILEEHKLLARLPGDRKADDAWVEQFSETIFKSTPEQAAEAAAAALAEGFAPDAMGEAITLAANQLILRDYGRRPSEEVAGKPIGSVHGDSIGVHACDSANAWRNMARVSNARNTFASIILGAYQLALDRTQRGGDFLNWQALPHQRYLSEVKATDAETLLREMEEGIRNNMQAHVTGLIQRYGELGHPERPVFNLMLKYAVSEDGALHAEKFYRTVSEEFAQTRAKFRWRHLIALGRVTASEYGRPAAGLAQARELLKT